MANKIILEAQMQPEITTQQDDKVSSGCTSVSATTAEFSSTISSSVASRAVQEPECLPLPPQEKEAQAALISTTAGFEKPC